MYRVTPFGVREKHDRAGVQVALLSLHHPLWTYWAEFLWFMLLFGTWLLHAGFRCSGVQPGTAEERAPDIRNLFKHTCVYVDLLFLLCRNITLRPVLLNREVWKMEVRIWRSHMYFLLSMRCQVYHSYPSKWKSLNRLRVGRSFLRSKVRSYICTSHGAHFLDLRILLTP